MYPTKASLIFGDAHFVRVDAPLSAHECVIENREQPGAHICAELVLLPPGETADHRLGDEVFCFVALVRELERKNVERNEERERFFELPATLHRSSVNGARERSATTGAAEVVGIPSPTCYMFIECPFGSLDPEAIFRIEA